MEQPAKPHLNAVEKGRHFAPEYGEPLWTFDIKTAEWTHLCSARYGPPRPTFIGTGTKWSGDSYRYDIFEQEAIGGRFLLALRWQNGSGEGWLCSLERDNTTSNLLRLMYTIDFPEAQRWDMCHFLWETATKSATAAKVSEGALYRQAFINGRLKKRKARGQVRVEIEPNWVVKSEAEGGYFNEVTRCWVELARATRYSQKQYEKNEIPRFAGASWLTVDHTSEVCSLVRNP